MKNTKFSSNRSINFTKVKKQYYSRWHDYHSKFFFINKMHENIQIHATNKNISFE